MQTRQDHNNLRSKKYERGERGYHQSPLDDIHIMKPGERATSAAGDGRGRGNSQSSVRGGRGRGVRGGRGRGRGRGRGYHGQNNATKDSSNNKNIHNGNKRAIWIYTSNFDSFHRKCEAARYKVHKPNCSCNKVQQHILPRANEVVTFHTLDDEGTQKDHNNDSGDHLEQHNITYYEGGQNKDDQRRRQQQLQKIVSIEEYVILNADLSRSDSNCNPKDGLVVVPDTKNVQAVYICSNTYEQIFHEDPFKAERKLKSEIFSFSNASINNCNDAEGVQNDNQFKVSCAACLLEDEPNGFVCISSTDLGRMNHVRDVARDAALTKQQGESGIETKLHADHAHYCITLPRSSLVRLARSRTRNQTSQAKDELFEHMKAQGLPVNVEASETPAPSGSGGETGSSSVEIDIDLQHHLKSSLNILTNDSNQEDEIFIFVIVYDDTAPTTGKKPCWSFDLPGGKRHLAETAVEAAIRETEEECSLVWDKSWIRGMKQGTKESDRCNRFYLLSPPAAPAGGSSF